MNFLFGEDMAKTLLFKADLSCSSHTVPLCSGFSCFHLGHCFAPSIVALARNKNPLELHIHHPMRDTVANSFSWSIRRCSWMD